MAAVRDRVASAGRGVFAYFARHPTAANLLMLLMIGLGVLGDDPQNERATTEFTRGADNPSVVADPQQVEQVLFNLLPDGIRPRAMAFLEGPLERFGGALGNVIDRALHGCVVDFLDLHVAGWHWPAFNLADSGITLGVVLLLIDGLFLDGDGGKKGSKSKNV